jgi:hypothetical protein
MLRIDTSGNVTDRRLIYRQEVVPERLNVFGHAQLAELVEMHHSEILARARLQGMRGSVLGY